MERTPYQEALYAAENLADALHALNRTQEPESGIHLPTPTGVPILAASGTGTAWGYIQDALAMIVATLAIEVNGIPGVVLTDHTPDSVASEVIHGIYDNNESVAYNLDRVLTDVHAEVAYVVEDAAEDAAYWLRVAAFAEDA